jgi:hypothetical protein
MSKNFLKEYHSTVVKAAGENAKNLNIKMGIIMANKWVDDTAKFDNNKEFGDFFESYLRELGFAESVNVNCDEENYTIDIKGCLICHGNEILRQEGIGTACPIVQTAKYAMVKKMGRNVVIKGIDKPGSVGECVIRFGLE